jgi:hypothetical protein
VKPITVMDAATFCESVAVTDTALSGVVAKARQISAVPLCTFVLTTSFQVRPAPDTLVTLVLGAETLSVETKASSNSLADFVENAAVAIVELAVD